MIIVELTLVFLLILLNGFLAMSELAVVSARRTRLQAMAASGVGGAATALRLASSPGRFLSTVQIGITLVGVLAGAFSGATLGEKLGAYLIERGVSPGAANAIALVGVVAGVTYLSLIVGELVPKQIALRNPERVAAFVARTMEILSKIVAPAVWLLDLSSRLVLRLLGSKAKPKDTVTEDEIKMVIAEAESAGVLEPAEKEMMAAVLRFGDRPVQAIMTPRHDVDWVDVEDPEPEIRRKLMRSHHSRLPVGRGTIDEVIGVVQAKDLLNAFIGGGAVRLKDHVKQAPVVHESVDALEILTIIKGSPVHVALVVDEYGVFQGLVTSGDVLESIAGAFAEPGGEDDPDAVQRDDGSWLFSGGMPVDEMADRLMIALPSGGYFHTVAGFILHSLKRLPRIGEVTVVAGWRFEVVDMDGRRIDKVLATRVNVGDGAE
jgi:putative hemolysin